MKEEKDFEGWGIKKNKINNRNLKPLEILVGDIWWVYIGANIGTEIDGKGDNWTRPVIVLKIIDNTSIFVAPLTSSKFYNNKWHPILNYDFIDSNGKFKKSKVCLNQVKAIDYRRLKIRICNTGDEEYYRIMSVFDSLYKAEPALLGRGAEYLRSDASVTSEEMTFDISISNAHTKSIAQHDYNAEALALHKEHHGKIGLQNKVKLENRDDLSRAYTPGVAAVCLAIANAGKVEGADEIYSESQRLAAREYTLKRNTVAIVSDGSAVLGLGNIGPLGAIPVMEGKAAILKEFAGVDGFPICLDTQDTEEIIKVVKQIAPVFGAINLEDIAAPRCFEIEERLRRELDIPVMHDDQWGTATVVLAGLINATRLRQTEIENTNRKSDEIVLRDIKDIKLSEIKIIINGVGSAGVAVARLLMAYGFTDILFCDSKGLIHTNRNDLTKEKIELLEKSIANPLTPFVSLSEAIKNRDVFIGLSKPGTVTSDMVRSMNNNPIIFSLANPTPEIMPEEAHAAGVFIMATGRSDYPNQLNNSLIFPGLFKGMLTYDIRQFSIDIFMRAALALANHVTRPNVNAILPSMFDKTLVEKISKSVLLKN